MKRNREDISPLFFFPECSRQDTDATQDWYLCSNKNFVITSSASSAEGVRHKLKRFLARAVPRDLAEDEER